MTWLALLVAASFAGYFASVIRKTGLLSAEAVFVYVQLTVTFGTFSVLDPTRDADRVHANILAYVTVAFMVASWFLHLRTGSESGEIRVRTFKPGPRTVAFLLVSMMVTAVYYSAIGHVTILSGLSNVFTSSSNDVTSLRLESYSGSRYLFPGYVNQFKNTLLPALALVIFTYWIRRHHLPLFSAVVLALAVVVALMGTGQRGAFIVFGVTAVTYLYLLDRRSFPRHGLLLGAAVIPIILLATLALGRSAADIDPDAGVGKQAVVAAKELGGRIAQGSQTSSAVAFRHIYENKETQYGQEWGVAFAGVFPGQAGSPLAREVFKIIYGSTRGTSPESKWGSIYYNFGLSGIIISPFLFAIIAATITRKIRSAADRNTLTTIGMAGTIAIFGTWMSSTPVYLLNNGIVVFILLWLIGSRHDARLRNAQGGISNSSSPGRSTWPAPQTSRRSVSDASA